MGEKLFDVFPPAVGTEILGNWCLRNGYPLACASASIWTDGQTTPPSLWQAATPHSIPYGSKAWGSPESTPQQALKPCCKAMLTCDPLYPSAGQELLREAVVMFHWEEKSYPWSKAKLWYLNNGFNFIPRMGKNHFTWCWIMRSQSVCCTEALSNNHRKYKT